MQPIFMVIKKSMKILQLAIENEIKLIINGGDMLPKLGNRFSDQPAFINEYLRNYFRQLEKNKIRYLVMLGNDDLLSMDRVLYNLTEEFDNIHYITDRKVNIDGYDFIGMDKVLDHPFGCKDRVVIEKNYWFRNQLNPYAVISNDAGYDKIYDWIDYALGKLPRMNDILYALPKPIDYKKAIYIMYMPPAHLKLGQLLSRDVDIGSNDIRNFIEEYQPLLTLHGHFHESPDTSTGIWLKRVIKTTCIQPGQTEFGSGKLVYAEIDLEEGKFSRKKEPILSLCSRS